ncbi:MAG: CRISPR-associated protein Csx11 [Candidatus Nanoarchaeia archaeon]|nr:CRISPR-associated protein Csx11 [Candidatus Jingweiarchaeum tengchongense]
MSLIDIIKSNRENILIGEIGAFLHDIGKLHPDFVKKQSLENIGNFDHSKAIDTDKSKNLVDLLNNLKLKLKGEESSVYYLIVCHHNKTENLLIKFLQICDRKDSSDDKGIVRRKQSINNTFISSPFGYPKEKIDLTCLQKRFEDLKSNLTGLFDKYISNEIDLTCLRNSLINNLKTAFSHALGETRIPSNDVTLWDHSYSTASLFKSVLAALVYGADIKPQDLNWRILGIFWNGIEFISRGVKVAEIKARSEIIENIKSKLRKKFENEIPIGNSIYEDTNGIYFTFPDFDRVEELAKECAKESLEIVCKESDNELWPSFSLSKASGTLTIIVDEMKLASNKRRIPRMTSTLFISGEPRNYYELPEIAIPNEGQDICPICRVRPKNEYEERCEVCDKRRGRRLSQWLSNRENTIWIDEVSDRNNRIALISLNFDLEKWLDGTMIGTIYSQTFEDWINSRKWSEVKDNLKDSIEANKEGVYTVLNEILSSMNSDKDKTAELLKTFFEDVSIDKNSLENHISNIKERVKEKVGSDVLTKENLATYLFTQNPSPARLYRIWKETEEFFNLVVEKLREKYYYKWKRIKFSVDYKDLRSKLKDKSIEDTPLIIKVKELNPEALLVFHSENGEFYTIESLEKFSYSDKMGENAVKEALKQEIDYLALEEKSKENLLNEMDKISANDIEIEGYYPFIEINRSPLLLRFIIPALDSIEIIKMITELYKERFKKVIGKLPLNIKLLVTKRKFPLYILLDAEKRILEDEEFKKQVAMNPWWDIEKQNEKYYAFYPIKLIENEKYTLDDLSPISKGETFYLYPGYFDFDLLLGTTDRYKICYKNRKRGDEEYKLFTGRPYYFYRISKTFELWDILVNNLSSSQINFVEEILTSKLREWKDVKDKNDVFRTFAEVVLKDAFGDKWNKLEEEDRLLLVNSTLDRLLIDVIILSRHIIKEEVL